VIGGNTSIASPFELETDRRKRSVNRLVDDADEALIGQLGAPIASNVIIGRSDKAVLRVPVLTAYQNAFELLLEVYVKPGVPCKFEWIAPMLRKQMWRTVDRLPDEMMRFGLGLAEGQHLYDADETLIRRKRGEPSLYLLEAGTTSTTFNLRYLAPLMPTGAEVLFVAEWPIMGISLTEQRLPSKVVREAGERSAPAWTT
jgi:hypothetical protein